MSLMYYKPGYRPGRAALRAAKAPSSRRAWGVAFVGGARRAAAQRASASAGRRLGAAACQGGSVTWLADSGSTRHARCAASPPRPRAATCCPEPNTLYRIAFAVDIDG
eukprot:scaffold132196_cov105-Phaeocystis_antarctica.AAC.1